MVKKKENLSLLDLDEAYEDLIDFKSLFLTSHLITYIGNKRKLLPFINDVVIDIKKNLGKQKIDMLDGFAGSGVVSRLFKHHANRLISNDFEDYTKTINGAYLSNTEDVDIAKLQDTIDFLNSKKLAKTKSGYFITKNYAPKDDNHIKPGERVFYTNSNARIIDNIRYLIENNIEPDVKNFCLANLLVRASVHTNTSGVFKGFHKRDGIGHFGGDGENALSRIKSEITLECPIFSKYSCDVEVTNQDTNTLVETIKTLDVAYFDPPYNQHPYGSNYFMLNIINSGKKVEIQDGVSGITKHWNRSDYNKKEPAKAAMDNLLGNTNAKYILISYNNEGIIPISDFQAILNKHGTWQLYEQEYSTYRGSRNLRNRDIKVQELLWVLKKR